MKALIAFAISAFFYSSCALAQQSSSSSVKASDHGLSKRFFFYWGYNGAIFTHCDIHFSAPDYDFTLFSVVAHDRPSPFSFKLYFGPTTITIPQYNYRVGYYINDRLSISFGQDHMKYVIDSNQSSTISGVISAEASEKYAGEYLQDPITVTTDFVKFEHTDGLNLVSLDLEYTLPLIDFFQTKLRIELNSGVGVAMMIPRTDVRVFGYGLNNNFHLAGYAVNVKTGPQIRFFQHYFIRAQARAGYIDLPDILIHNEAPDRAEQNFSFLEYYVVAGILFPFKTKSEK